MKSKFPIIITSIVLVLISIFALRYVMSKNSKAVDEKASPAITDTVEETNNSSNSEVSSEFAVEGTTYNISDPSEVSYIVQKRFLQKEDAEVTGTTTSVDGSGVYNEESGDYEIKIEVDLSTLSTDSAGRDNDILKLFTPSTAAIVIKSSDNEKIIMGEEQVVDAEVTINNVTMTLPLSATIDILDGMLVANGETTFNMSDFGITPPNAIGIYTVDDETVVRFDITAKN